MASGGEASESLQCKICVLKVSIHCEGCRKKVNRILRSIPGVYDCEVNARQHKVTVKASVDPQVLIRKLERSKKHATLWPESKPARGDAGGEKESMEPPAKPEESPDNPEKKPSPPESNPHVAAAAAAPAQASDPNKSETEAKSAASAEPPVPEGKTEEGNTKAPQSSEAKNADASVPQPEKPAAATAVKADDNNEKKADSGKKKDSKPPKEDSEVASANSDSSKTCTHMSSPPQPPPPPPLQDVYSHSAYATPPAYVMSYNVAKPSISQAYYASPMPPASQGYAYAPYPPPPEYYYGSTDTSSWASTQAHDMFSDENPNSCNLM